MRNSEFDTHRATIRGRWIGLALGLVVGLSLMLIGGAQATVITDNGVSAGIAPVPGSSLSAPGVTIASGTAPCLDPALSSDLIPPVGGLCSHSGPVIHQNETFAFTWDADRRYWSTTRNYVEQYLQDVAAGSGSLGSPYAVATQYTDATGRALNSSVFGGGCIDYGSHGGLDCKLGNTNGTGAGHDYPASSCPATGTDPLYVSPSGLIGPAANDRCLTDADIQSELQAAVVADGLAGHVASGYTPLLVVLTPERVVDCLDAAGTVCSGNSAAQVQFCSYHSQVTIGGTEWPYVVQPWTPLSGCDDPGVPALAANPTPQALAVGVGQRLVSPISQGELSAIVDPNLASWYAINGAEISDNGCIGLPQGLDSTTIGTSGQNPYFIQREANNAGQIESDPNAPACAGSVELAPTFVTPSAVNAGDVVQLDGSTTVSTLIVPRDNYKWDFGDGTGAIGPSVAHSYAKAGTYQVTLTATDRGGNVRAVTEPVVVIAPGVPPGPTVTPTPAPTPKTPGTPKTSALRVHLQLMPQGLGSVRRRGLKLAVTSTESATGIATIAISRGAARRAHIRGRHGASVVIGLGTITGITDGTVTMHLRFTRSIAKKLGRLRHVTLTVRLALTSKSGQRMAIDVAGRY